MLRHLVVLGGQTPGGGGGPPSLSGRGLGENRLFERTQGLAIYFGGDAVAVEALPSPLQYLLRPSGLARLLSAKFKGAQCVVM